MCRKEAVNAWNACSSCGSVLHDAHVRIFMLTEEHGSVTGVLGEASLHRLLAYRT